MSYFVWAAAKCRQLQILVDKTLKSMDGRVGLEQEQEQGINQWNKSCIHEAREGERSTDESIHQERNGDVYAVGELSRLLVYYHCIACVI